MARIQKRIVRFFSVVLLIIVITLPGNGGIVFSDLDISPDNRLLFIAGSGSGGISAQDALFVTSLSDTAMGTAAGSGGPPVQQLTVFPEKMDLLENGRVLQIRNAFGSMRLPVSGGLPMPIPGLPSFAGGNPATSGRAEEMAPSADGRWLLYLDPVSYALGNLVILDVYSGAKTRVASLLERPEKNFPAVWSPDSRYFIYEREGKLYYHAAGTSPQPVQERTRLVGEGTVNSISWGRGGDFHYIRGSTVYHVHGAELFARSLYTDFLEIGIVAGKIPVEFDPDFDNFWIAPDGKSLLVSKDRRNLFYFPLNINETEVLSEALLPYLLLPRSCSGLNVLWSQAGIVTVLVAIPNQAGLRLNAWRLNLAGEGGAVFEQLQPPAGTGPGAFHQGSLSPDGRLALFWGNGGILLYDYAAWNCLNTLSVRPGSVCIWAGNAEFYTGDDQKVERVQLARNNESGGVLAQVTGRELVCLSRTSQAGFEERSFRILAKSGSDWYVTDGRSPWEPIRSPSVRNPSQASARYRVYVERQGRGFYDNLPMIRNLGSVGTFSLFPPDIIPAGSPVPRLSGAAPSEPVFTGTGVFNQGSRTGLREITLTFDLYDDDRGLPEILDALNRYGIKATFFLNGEFIRRHPLAVSDIAAAGHEAASMFYAPIDLSDSRYHGGAEFISRGLARNEDEFFRVTGKELALLWHPPWYTVSADISAAAARAGYITCGRDIDPLDWVSREDEQRLGLPHRSPAQMIDYIMDEVRPGSVIPIRLGLLPGGRTAYLFNRINVLLDALVREGYTFATVSTLMEHAR